MKLKIGEIEKNLFRSEGIEFDDEGFLINPTLLFPMKKRQQREMCLEGLNSRTQSKCSLKISSVSH